MTATVDNAVADLQRANAELRRQLDERTAERDEALDQQTATAEVLQVINSSPGDLAPVFDAMLEKALRLCVAAFGVLWTYEGVNALAAAMSGVPAAFADMLTRGPHAVSPDNALGILLRGETRVIHLADAADTEAYRSGDLLRRAMVDLGGARTMLGVPLRKDDVVLGIFVIYRQEVRPFSDKQIALAENFAAQAMIAMENARLFADLRERTGDLQQSLEYQTATSDVFKVISRSTFDLQPVLDTLVETAAGLCDADGSGIALRDGDVFRYAAVHAVYGIDEYSAFLRQQTFGPGQDTTIGRVALEGDVVHIADIAADPDYALTQSSTVGKIRTNLGVPLLREGAVIGMLTLFRQHVEPFTDRQIELVRTFAAQAVIAIENTRLITETREALEQQTATAEVLQVINSSPGDLTPVFEAILEKAHSLCGAVYGSLNIYEDDQLRAVAVRGLSEGFADRLRSGIRPGAAHPAQALHRGVPFVQVPDVAEIDDPVTRAAFEIGGLRTVLFVPLRKDERLLGNIVAARPEVRLFSDKQIALLQNFAAQAVVAMENARLITETREALEQQTATAEVLGVINSSPGDLAPVFDAMLEKATRLCEADGGTLWTFDGEFFHPAVVCGVLNPAINAMRAPVRPGPGVSLARMVQGENVIHIVDVAVDKGYQANVEARSRTGAAGARSILAVALRKDDALLGAITTGRLQVRPYSDKQIALLQNFAAQAVIAIENARLLGETREALEQQTATAEVLGVINSSPGELAPVFDAMLEKAIRLCEAAFGILWTYDGELFHAVAFRDVPPGYAEFLREPHHAGPLTGLGRVASGEAFAHIIDMLADEGYRTGDPVRRAGIELAGARTHLSMPLRKDDVLLGNFAVFRTEVRPFTDKQIALVQNFAAQAVIAIENTRLITETREALDQQTATAEVLQVINSSPGDLAPVFDAILEKAHALCGSDYGSLQVCDGDQFRAVAVRGLPAAVADWLREGYRALPGHHVSGLLDGAPFVQVPDLAASSGAIVRPAVGAGMRTLLVVPLRQDDRLLGCIASARPEVRLFSEKEIALLQSFAAQAVIAMENARLITETREALEQQTATAEVLGVINSSPGDLAPVFDAMLDKAMRLCGAAFGLLSTYDGERFRQVALREAFANRDQPSRYAEYLATTSDQPGPSSASQRLLRGEHLVHILDLSDEELYRSGDPYRRALVDIGGARTLLAIGLRKDDALLGVINIYRQEVRPFTDKQIALLHNFAAQAVIAMENARLITETREALDQQTATAEVLGVINSSPGDLAPVFDAMLEKATRLCDGTQGIFWTYDGDQYLAVAFLGVDPQFAAVLREPVLLPPASPLGRVAHGEPFVQVLDMADTDAYRSGFPLVRAVVDLGKVRSLVVVPLIKDGAAAGIFAIARNEVRPFTEKQIALLQNFAAQAVIAMENARLITETREARDDAEAALGHLKAAQANLIQAEKMASLGQLTAGIAHEIKNPLNFVNNFADLSGELLKELQESAAPGWAALDEDKRAEIDETITMLTGNLEKIGEHGRRADGIVKSMLEHSRGVTSERRVVDLNNLIEEALNLAYHGARAQDQTFNIRMDREFDRDLAQIELVPQEMSRVFINLFGNGFYAATKRHRDSTETEFQPTLTVATRDLGGVIEVRVRDNGVGIPADIRDKLFQPFFTTKPTGEGTGLGLSISYDIVTQQHGGTISVDSRVGEFTEFTIRLPRGFQASAAT